MGLVVLVPSVVRGAAVLALANLHFSQYYYPVSIGAARAFSALAIFTSPNPEATLMTDVNHLVRAHYHAGSDSERALLLRVAHALGELGEPFTSERLASIDQFHVGGPRATAALAERASPAPGTRVLDAGSGLGGSSRFLAEAYACDVTGVDLSPHYVAVARYLSERAALTERTRFTVGHPWAPMGTKADIMTSQDPGQASTSTFNQRVTP
jgi:hypothetical protein